MLIRKILSEYQAHQTGLQRLRRDMEEKLWHLLAPMTREIHMITGRVKTENSLIDKLLDRHNAYTSLSDVTDTVGMRIVTYCENRVEQVTRMLQDEFRILLENRQYVRGNLQPHEFGYLSNHMVVESPAEMGANLQPVEIQVRSILQHSWAENEHSLGYDNPLGLPEDLKRRLHRLAALLELADEEMNSVDTAIRDYNRKMLGRFSDVSRELTINVFSVEGLINSSPQVREADKAIAVAAGADLHVSHAFTKLIPFHMVYLGFRGIQGVLRYLEQHQSDILNLAHRTGSESSLLAEGISLWYLCLHKACAPREVNSLAAFLTDNEIEIEIGIDVERADSLAAAQWLLDRLDAPEHQQE